MAIVTLSFENRDAETTDTMAVDAAATAPIARWYGSYNAGDDYDILIDGQAVDKDVNGEIGAF